MVMNSNAVPMQFVNAKISAEHTKCTVDMQINER